MNAALFIPQVVMGLGIAPHGAPKCLAGSGAALSTAPELMARAATTSDSFNAVAEPRRREILNYLALQERTVGDIVVDPKMKQPSVSKYLRVLRNVGLVRVRRDGRQMFYRMNAEGMRPLHEWTKSFEALCQHRDSRGRAHRSKADTVACSLVSPPVGSSYRCLFRGEER